MIFTPKQIEELADELEYKCGAFENMPYEGWEVDFPSLAKFILSREAELHKQNLDLETKIEKARKAVNEIKSVVYPSPGWKEFYQEKRIGIFEICQEALKDLA